MGILPIQGSPAEKQYKGCGKAWVAINKSAEVVGIKYMHDFQANYSSLPEWLKKAHFEYFEFSSRACLEPRHYGSRKLAEIKNQVIAFGHPATGPNGGNIKPSDIIKKGRKLVAELEKEQFGEYRLKCRKELAELGEVMSGMLSCYEFVPKGY
jgi:hypothetical protein